jgi:hypothetical protein
MAGSTYGNKFSITTWGESHGKALGVVVDGCPSGLSLDESDIQEFLDRRKPGYSKYSTPRKEADQVEIPPSVPEIMEILPPITDPDMPTTPLTANTVSEIIGEAAAPQEEKPSAELQPEP